MRIKAAIDIRVSREIGVPALHGAIKPVLLIPHGLSESFTDDELRHVIIHELWHLRRRDVAVRWLVRAIHIVHWFNPLVWFAVGRIEEERELACDERTLAALEDHQRLDYGRTILKLLERFRSAQRVPALVGIINEREKMKRRLIMIRGGRRGPGIAGVLLIMLTATCLFAFADARDAEGPTVDVTSADMLQRLAQPVTLDVTNVSLDDLAAILRVPLTVPDAPPLRRARFNVHAANVPAEGLLIEAMAPMGFVPEPRRDVVHVARAPACVTRRAVATHVTIAN
jgi:bla regulator protein BlaR1